MDAEHHVKHDLDKTLSSKIAKKPRVNHDVDKESAQKTERMRHKQERVGSALKKALHAAVVDFIWDLDVRGPFGKVQDSVIVLDDNTLHVKIANDNGTSRYKLQVKLVKVEDAGKK